MAIATPAVSTSLGEDLYVTLLASDATSGSVSLHVFVNPLVVWIWIGGAVVGIGAAFAAWPEARRVRALAAEPIAVPGPASVEGA
jgi:cytochrome c-type biogenesis protein CcmF